MGPPLPLWGGGRGPEGVYEGRGLQGGGDSWDSCRVPDVADELRVRSPGDWHECLAEGCTEQVPPDKPLCWPHWKEFPNGHQRLHLVRQWREGLSPELVAAWVKIAPLLAEIDAAKREGPAEREKPRPRPKVEASPERACAECGRPLSSRRRTYCSSRCSARAHFRPRDQRANLRHT